MTPLADPERALAVSYAAAARREALAALWALDERFGAIVAGTSEAAIGEMRLLWWREALERPSGEAPGEPLLRAIDALVKPLEISGEEIGAMAEGWHALLGQPLDRADIERHARERGGRLFALSARVLGEAGEQWIERAGEGWALIDLARRTSDGANQALALDMARAVFASEPPRRWPRASRPLGALAVLARSDARGGDLPRRASPARVARMLRMRLTGK